MHKTEADKLFKLEIWWLLRDMDSRYFDEKIITWGESRIDCKIELDPYFPKVRLMYRITNRDDTKKDVDYVIPLETTPCHFGGERYWFICPLYKDNKRCGRRVGAIYMVGDYFGCRHCHELTYRSRNHNRSFKHYSLFKCFELNLKLERLAKNIKRYTWRGEPTRKYRKFLKIESTIKGYYQGFEKSGLLKQDE